jgi:hypothetical protein
MDDQTPSLVMLFLKHISDVQLDDCIQYVALYGDDQE